VAKELPVRVMTSRSNLEVDARHVV
jgi:hypothetical protein